MKRIFYIANARMPTEKAHGIQIAKMCEASANLGYKMVLVLPNRRNYIKDNIFSYYNVADNFKVVKLRCIDLLGFCRTGVLGRLAYYLESVTFALSVGRFLKERQFDILYTRSAEILLFLPKKRYTIAYEAHNVPAAGKKIFKKLLAKVNYVIVITHSLKREFERIGFGRDLIYVAPDGVDIKQFDLSLSKRDARLRLNLPHDKKIVLYAGHLYPWKGADVLARASEYFGYNFLFLFVGGMERDIKKIKDKLKDIKVKNLKFVGRRPYSEIPVYLRAADVLVVPNRSINRLSKHYTSPMKLFEYMSSGRPIVASDLPSIREILSLENSFLIQPDNARALADGINEVLNNQELAEKRAAAARKEAFGYSWSMRARGIFDFIG